MTRVEFLQMIPALLFGISLAELALYLGKASAGNKKLYWEHFMMIAISFETIIFNWYIFYDRINNMETNYVNFLVQLISPLACFIYVANLLVDNEFPNEPREKYFQKNRKRIFLSLCMFVTINLFTVIYFHHNIHIGFWPAIPITIMIINAFYDLKWLRIFAYTAKTIQVVMVCIYFK
jgi:hypothetical protein